MLHKLKNSIKILSIFYFNIFKNKIFAILNYYKLLKIFKNYEEINIIDGANIGDVYLNLDIALKSKKKNIIISKDFNQFCVPYIANILKKKINIIFSTKLFLLATSSPFLRLKINQKNIDSFDASKYKDIIKYLSRKSKKKLFFLKILSKENLAYSEKKLKLKTKKIIFYSNRDNFYKNDATINSFRNSSIKKSYLGLEYLKKKKYETIRIGYYKFKKTNLLKQYKPRNIIERNKIEAYVAKKCLFAIVSCSGIQCLPLFFDKPLLIHNFIGFNKPPLIKSGIIIPKILTYESGEIVPIKDLFIKNFFSFEYDSPEGKWIPLYKVNIGAFQSDKAYKMSNITYSDNAEDEILNGMIEMEKYFILKKQLDTTHMKLDQKFKKLFPRNHWIRDSKVLVSYYWLKKYLHLYDIN
jgi:putative glycosyltransferase (TIGR04372 family)